MSSGLRRGLPLAAEGPLGPPGPRSHLMSGASCSKSCGQDRARTGADVSDLDDLFAPSQDWLSILIMLSIFVPLRGGVVEANPVVSVQSSEFLRCSRAQARGPSEESSHYMAMH
jgi:hypothetical protein